MIAMQLQAVEKAVYKKICNTLVSSVLQINHILRIPAR
jgi:hypothetical protein